MKHLEQIVQRNWGIFVLGNFQDLTQQSPGQCGLNSVSTCFEQQARLEIFRGPFQPGQFYELPHRVEVICLISIRKW